MNEYGILSSALREYAEWIEINKYKLPIALYDDLLLAANAIDELLAVNRRQLLEIAVLSQPKNGKRERAPVLGAPVWFLYQDEDADGAWEIQEDRITGYGLEGFWCPDMKDNPDRMGFMTPWNDVGEIAFFDRNEAEEKRKELTGGAG